MERVSEIRINPGEQDAQGNGSNETRKPSGKDSECSRVLGEWMIVYGQVFRVDLDPLTVAAYARALAGLSARVVDLAFHEAMCRSSSAKHGFMPTPAEILDGAEAVRERLPALPPVKCQICDGCGWRPVQRRDGPGTYMVRCNHDEAAGSE